MKLKFIRLPYRMVVIDIECLSLHDLRPVIDEIGVIVTDILPITEPLDTLQVSALNTAETGVDKPYYYSEYTLYPDLFEQIFDFRRNTDLDTIAFREAALRKNSKDPQRRLSVSLSVTNKLPAKAVVDRLNLSYDTQGEGGTETWANHTDFDLPRIQTLYEDVGERVPWPYKTVRDISTLRDLAGRTDPPGILPNPKHPKLDTLNTHLGVEDCRWNLWQIACSGFYHNYPQIELDV